MTRIPLSSPSRFSERGDALLSVLCALWIASLLSMSLFAMVAYQGKIVQAQKDYAQAYWLAKGHAAATLRALKNGVVPPSSATQHFATGDVLSQAVTDSSIHVTVTGYTKQAVSRVAFSFNPTTRSVLTWQENLPVTQSNTVP